MKRRDKLTRDECVAIMAWRLRSLLSGKGAHDPGRRALAIEYCAQGLRDYRFDPDPIFLEFQ